MKTFLKRLSLINNDFNLENEPLSALIHFVGLLASIVALVIMVVLAVMHGTVMHVVGFSIFGASLVLLYASSFFYHSFPQKTKAREVFLRIDHSMIFFLIAGSYTPICLTMDNRAMGWSLFGIIWVISIIGIVLKSVGIKIKPWKSTLIYILLGLLLLIAIYPLSQWLPTQALFWLFGGGALYIIGAIFFILEDYVPRKRKFDLHEIWHIFVMLASFSHWYLMIKFVLYR